MIRLTKALLAASATALVTLPASAGFPVQIDKVCPVGGEKFTHTTTGSYSIFGARPDGKPFGSWTFPIAIPQCPENRLVVYRDFEEDEIEELTKLVRSDEYKALHEETSYYRAAWLAKKMDAEDQLLSHSLLLRATWQLDHDPAKKARYQRKFATTTGTLALNRDDLNTLFLRFRVANAWRELGEFPKALSQLDAISAALAIEDSSEDEGSSSAQRDAEARAYLLEDIPKMRSVIEAGDTSSDPLNLMPTRQAARQCREMIEEGKSPLPQRCEAPDVQEELKKLG